MHYRAEIDGLRALAVMSVLIFHFFPSSINYGFNGYLGVDVFFVISGFLISKYIYRQLTANKFSFKEFYIRRIRRILPVALFSLIPTTIVFAFILIPHDQSAYFNSLLASIFFIPNIYFWRSGGYFGDLDSLKPLLHYWSLGVEEQFYLVFPLFVFFCFKLFGKNKVGFLILILTISSLILNFFVTKFSGFNSSFFFFPTRIWEFGLGALAAYYSNTHQLKLPNMVSNTLFFIIIISFFLYKPFAALPIGIFIVITTSIFLFFNHSKNSLSYIALSNRFSLFFGKTSFSIYLIHWPVIVFLNYIYVDDVPSKAIIFGLFLVIAMSYFSYELIEKPFRYNFSNRFVFTSILCVFISLVAISLIGIKTNLLHQNNSLLVKNLSNQIQSNYRCPVSSTRPFGARTSCILKGSANVNEVDLFIVGNSHAQMYSPIFKESDRYENIMLVPLNGCLPTPNVNRSDGCANRAKINFATLQNIDNNFEIVIAMTWYEDQYYKNGKIQDKKSLLDDLLSMVNAFSAKGNKVYVISPIPIPEFNHASDLSRKLKFKAIDEEEYISLSSMNYSRFYDEISVFDKALSSSSKTNYIKVYKNLCDENLCYFGDLSGSYFSDADHLSKHGLKKVSASFNTFF